jgi:hypothetical protein
MGFHPESSKCSSQPFHQAKRALLPSSNGILLRRPFSSRLIPVSPGLPDAAFHSLAGTVARTMADA